MPPAVGAQSPNHWTPNTYFWSSSNRLKYTDNNETCTYVPTRKITQMLTFCCIAGGSDGKESACNARDLDSIPVLGRSPGEGNGNLLHYSCLENSMDRGALRSTVDYSPWGCKESRCDWMINIFILLLCVILRKMYYRLKNKSIIIIPFYRWK